MKAARLTLFMNHTNGSCLQERCIESRCTTSTGQQHGFGIECNDADLDHDRRVAVLRLRV